MTTALTTPHLALSRMHAPTLHTLRDAVAANVERMRTATESRICLLYTSPSPRD